MGMESNLSHPLSGFGQSSESNSKASSIIGLMLHLSTGAKILVAGAVGYMLYTFLVPSARKKYDKQSDEVHRKAKLKDMQRSRKLAEAEISKGGKLSSSTKYTARVLGLPIPQTLGGYSGIQRGRIQRKLKERRK
jgi:hypothetical protein